MDKEQVAATATSFKDFPPEIQNMIGNFLNPHDLTVCVRVCQAWKTLFIPYIWRRIECFNILNWTFVKPFLWRCIDEPLYGLRRNAQHIQSMTIFFDYFTDNDRLFRHDADKYKEFDGFLDVCPASFPHLTSATLFGLCGRGDLVADFIRRGSPAGWKEISLEVFWHFNEDWSVRSAPEMVSAIFGQASTLTVLKLDGGGYISSNDIQQFLCTAPNLREFHLIGTSRTKAGPDPCLDAADVVQSEWVCLGLEVFGCAIGGIPRPDITRWIDGEPASEYTIDGSYNDSIDFQQRIYTQLARLVKLRSLSLGSPIAEFVTDDYDEDDYDEIYREDSPLRQFDCLAMSLESGLDLLKDLKELRSVKLVDMEVYVDNDKEQAWLSEHWPNALVET